MEGDVKVIKISQEVKNKIEDSNTLDADLVSDSMREQMLKENLTQFNNITIDKQDPNANSDLKTKSQKYKQGWRRLDLMEHFFIVQNTHQCHCDSILFLKNFLIVKSVYGRIKIYSITLQDDKVTEVCDFNTLSREVYEKLKTSKAHRTSPIFSVWESKMAYNSKNKLLYVGVDKGRIQTYDLRT